MNAIIENNKERLTAYCKKYDVTKMYVFGSVTSDKFKKDSDIDLLISFNKNLTLEEYADNFFDLYDNLESLFERKIDLMTERSLSNPYLIERIDEQKQLVYES